MKTYIKVSTRSNYKNLNGQRLEVKEFIGTIIATNINGDTVDFTLSEVVEIRSINN